MYVICDIEWIEFRNKKYSPTQIAAMKVDSDWNNVTTFSAFIRPEHNIKYNRKHVAFSGGGLADFESADSAKKVFETFYEWLCDDDVLMWWFGESDETFRQFTEELLGYTAKHRSITVTEYIRAHILDHECAVRSQYSVAKYLNINVSRLKKHYSYNDVTVAHSVLKKLDFPQEKFKDPPEQVDILPAPDFKYANFKYHYDPETNTIHSNLCGTLLANGINTIGYPSLATALRKRYKPCKCCKDEYKKALRERNADTISRTEHAYVFSPDSDIYHRRDCHLILNARSVMGAHTLDGVRKAGKKPCKVCNPPTENTLQPLPKKAKHKKKQIKAKIPPLKKILEGLENVSQGKDDKTESTAKKRFRKVAVTGNRDEIRAVKRQKVAAKERADKLREGLSQDELNNIYALTQPRYAFWAAKGHKYFHLRSCSMLQNLYHLRGFATYGEAKQAGFKPCKKCKPSSKHDLKVSVPIYNRFRENESIYDLAEMCKSEGFEYSIEGDVFSFTTSVGKWKIHTDTNPVKVEHINLAKNPYSVKYHEQHRVFLSLADVFAYITQHDEVMQEKCMATV